MCNLTGGSFQPALALLWSRQSGHTALYLWHPFQNWPKTLTCQCTVIFSAWKHNFDQMVPGFLDALVFLASTLLTTGSLTRSYFWASTSRGLQACTILTLNAQHSLRKMARIYLLPCPSHGFVLLFFALTCTIYMYFSTLILLWFIF